MDAGVSDPETLVDCTAGEPSRCIFSLEDSIGGGFAVHDDSIYWTDLGTRDERENYLYDGAIMRTRIGVWEREVVVGGLDFYDEEAHGYECIDLRALEDHVLWGGCREGGSLLPSYVSLSESQRTVRALPGIDALKQCAFAGSTVYCVAGDEVWRSDLALDSEWTVIAVPGGSFSSNTAAFYVEDALYLQDQTALHRLELSHPERGPLPLTPTALLVDVLPGPTLVALQGGRIVLAEDEQGEELVWKAVTASGGSAYAYIGTHEGWLYWWDYNDRTFARARLDGNDQSVWRPFGLSLWMKPRLSSRGIVTDMRTTNKVYAFAFEPFPAEPAERE